MAKDEKRLFTAQEIAELIGYTPQSVRNAAKALGIEHVAMEKKRFMYSYEQALVIAEHYNKRAMAEKALEPETKKEDACISLESQLADSEQQISIKDNEIENLKRELEKLKAESNKLQETIRKQIDTYSEQLAIKDKQIDDLIRDKEHLREENKALLGNVSLLNAADKKEVLLAEAKPQKEKKSFWARLLGK